jgi:hypothetical protein
LLRFFLHFPPVLSCLMVSFLCLSLSICSWNFISLRPEYNFKEFRIKFHKRPEEFNYHRWLGPRRKHLRALTQQVLFHLKKHV